MIVFDGVTKRYGTRTLFKDLDLEIRPGEFISIIGNSGSGKTTLLKMLLRIEHPTEGTIFVHNRDIRHLHGTDLQKHRRGIGCVFQDYKLLPNKTVYENVAFPLEAAGFRLARIVELVPAALSMLGLMHIQDNLPYEISGGEAQRVAIARAIVHQPRIVLADEPTGNLDMENAKQVLKNLIKINMEGVTVILTTHNRPLVDLIGQRVVTLASFSSREGEAPVTA